MCKLKVSKGVFIELTPEQLRSIELQSVKPITVNDINLEVAERLLKGTDHTSYTSSSFYRTKDWVSYQIETIIKATNFLDNNNTIWEPNFDNSSEYKYYPWFDRTKSGWVMCGDASYCHSDAYLGSGFHYKNKESMFIVVKNNFDLYKQWLPK